VHRPEIVAGALIETDKLRANVPLWPTLSVIGTVIGMAAWGAYHFSNTMLSLNASITDLKSSIQNLVIELRSKVGADDLDKLRELDCMRYQLANPETFRCPFAAEVMKRRPRVTTGVIKPQ
jgi:hypothetical protein